MSPKKFDGVIEAVRYNPDGSIKVVRVYERRGPTYSDRVLLDRNILVQRLKQGKNFVVGRRLPLLASEFSTGAPVRLETVDGGEVVVAGEKNANQDQLEGAPLF